MNGLEDLQNILEMHFSPCIDLEATWGVVDYLAGAIYLILPQWAAAWINVLQPPPEMSKNLII